MHKKKLINLIENKFKEEFYAVPIGTIFSFASANPPPGAFVLNGQIISNCRELFPDFWNWVMEENTKGTVRIISASNYESEIFSIGMCGGFVVDSENGSIRLPNISNGFIEGSNGNNVGNTINAGLPNITGNVANIDTSFNSTINENGIGALSLTSITNTGPALGGSKQICNLDINASKSSSIYGNSDTVQPKSICYQFCIQVYNSTSKLSTAIASQIISELQGKAGINLENLTSGGKQQILNTAFEISSISLNRQNLTANTIYQAEKTSLLWIRYTKSASGQTIYVAIGDSCSNGAIGNYYTYAPGSDAADFYIIIPKSYYIKVQAHPNITFLSLCFIPLKNSN